MGQLPWFHPILTGRPWWPGFPGRPASPVLPWERQRTRDTNESSTQRVHGFYPNAGRKTWPKGKKGCVDDTPEGPRLLGLQDQCDGTEGPSWEGPDRCPNPTSSPHSYLHARYAEEPVLAIDAWGTLLRSRVEGRLTMRRCLGSGHPHMSLCDSCILQVGSGSGHLAETHQPTRGREWKWEEDFGGWTTVLLLCGWQESQIAASFP